MPEPDRLSEPGELEALLTKETFPVLGPAVWGANVTVKGTLCPAGTVAGKVIPESENPAPFQLAEETVMLVLPAVSDPDWVALLPTPTLPKLMLAGVSPSCPAARKVIPESENPAPFQLAEETVMLVLPAVSD